MPVPAVFAALCPWPEILPEFPMPSPSLTVISLGSPRRSEVHPSRPCGIRPHSAGSGWGAVLSPGNEDPAPWIADPRSVQGTADSPHLALPFNLRWKKSGVPPIEGLRASCPMQVAPLLFGQ